jgi:hypothetical protein
VGCGGISGVAGGTFPLDCFCLGLVVGLWIEMVMALCLSVVDEKVWESDFAPESIFENLEF